jgi:outer membrane protein assembly factor BamB
MRGKFYFFIQITVFMLLCFVQISLAQTSLIAAGWDVAFRKCWDLEIARTNLFPPMLADEDRQTIFQPLDGGVLLAIDARRGTTLWRSQFGGDIVSNAVLDDNKIYLINKIPFEEEKNSKSEFVLRAVSPNTGLTLWQKNIAFSTDPSRIFISTLNRSIAIVSETGQIVFADDTTGAEIRRRDLNAEITAEPVFFANRIFAGIAGNKVLSVSADNGEIVSELNLKNSPAGSFFVSSEMLVVGDRAGNITAFRAADQKLLWKARAGAQIVDITHISGNFLISSKDGFVYLLSSRSGDRLWKKRLDGRLLGKPSIYDNFALFQTLDGSQASILDLNHGKLVNRIFYGESAVSVGGALKLNRRLVIPTSEGLQAYAADCDEK